MRWILLLLALLAGSAQAATFNPPGLEADSEALVRTLSARNPAGMTDAAKRAAEKRASEALARNDWPAAVSALETRVSAGDGSAAQWLQLAQAYLKTSPPAPKRAAQAGWLAFRKTETGPQQIPALLVMADAFGALGLPEQSVAALEAVVERAPDDKGYAQRLAEAQRAAGLLVRSVRTEPESDPPLACIEFTSAPARRGDVVPGDWVRLDPANPDAAVSRQGDAWCVAGLRLGATTSVTLREGLPGEGGLSLRHATTLAIAMPNRKPQLIFRSKLFVLPRSQAPELTLSSIGLSAVRLKLLRLSERNLVPWTRDVTLGQELERWNFEAQADNGTVVWEGTAPIPHWEPNALVRTKLPLPDVFATAGAYMLLATPGDGTPDSDAAAVQVIIRTDLAPTVWRGTDGLTVQVRSYADAAPRAGVKLSLLARNNDILAEATTDTDGVARFAAPLLAGEGPQAPLSIHGQAGNDLVTLDLTSAAFDLSDRGVAGMKPPGPLDGFAWTDRGIYRPGERVQVMALVRNSAGEPAQVPTHVVIKRPNGQVFLDKVPPPGPDASVYLPVDLSLSAPAGTWTVELLADPKQPPIGTGSFRVDAFVPDRMAVDAKPQGPIVPGQAYSLPVTARFLYGAPAVDLTGSAHVQLAKSPTPPEALAGFTVGLDGEAFAPDAQDFPIPATDRNGATSVPITLANAPDSTAPVQAEVGIAIDDPSGRSSRTSVTIPVQSRTGFIGIKPGFADGAIDAGSEAGFELAAVDRDGKRVAMAAKLRLVRERPDWRLVMRGSLARYQIVYKDEPIEAKDVSIPANGTVRYAKRLDFGRYRLEVLEANGLAASSVRFRAGWVASDNPDTPDKVDVSTDRKAYRPGDVAHVRIVSPFAGKATLLALGDRVFSLKTLDVPDGGVTADVPVAAEWGPGAYITVHVFRGGEAVASSPVPARAIGLAWAGIDPAVRTLPVSVQAPEKMTPRQRVVIPVKTAPGAWVTLAAVDEGILRLTNFVSPDPAAHYLGRRGLGIDIRDDWGRLIPPGQGDATVLSQGGDEGGNALPEIPQKTVTLFVGPVQAGPDGVAQVPLDMPDFNGQVRLMAVAWQGDKVGANSVAMIVRDPMVAEPLLPRFLAPGDEARMGVLMQAIDLPPGDGSVTVSVSGPLEVEGETRLSAPLEPNRQVVRSTVLKATGAGRGVITLDVAGPGGFAVRRQTAILIQSARPAVTVAQAGELAPSAEAKLLPPTGTMVPGTARASVMVGGAVRYDVSALVRDLHDYPLFCLEQGSSKGLPLTALPRDPARAAELQAIVENVLDKQRFDGGFGLWSASGEAQTWLSAYATEFLIRAQRAGAAVPEAALRDALKYLRDNVEGLDSDPAGQAAKAYYVYALALGGKPLAGENRVMASAIEGLPTPLAKAQVAAALALSNDRPRAEAAFRAALEDPARKYWDADRGSAVRDQFAIAVLLRESGLLPDELKRLIGRLPGANLDPNTLNTQEEAWGAEAGAVLGRDQGLIRVAVDGKPLAPASLIQVALNGPVSLRNLGDQAVWQTVSAAGVPSVPLPAARQGMRVSRKFLTLSGDPLDLDKLKQNTVFVLLLEGRADDAQEHRALVVQGLPAAWEIAGRLQAGKTDGMPWLGELSEVESQPALDDRFAATLNLTEDKPSFRVAVRVRAVTPGSYELPGAVLEDMYRPAIFSRQNTGRIKVLAPE